MAADTSEAKEFEASQRKLRKMREKGQFAQSQDVTTALSVLACSLYILFASTQIIDQLTELFSKIFDLMSDLPKEVISDAIIVSLYKILFLVLPVFGISILAALVSTATMGRGIRFAFDPLKPELSKINPTEGFKRMFGMKALFRFAVSFVKAVVLVAVLVLLHKSMWNDLVHLPRNYLSDSTPSELASPGTFLIILILLFIAIILVIAAIDFVVQKKLFLNEAKMTRTERKDEAKEQEGDPHQRSYRKTLAKENIERPSGVKLATFTLENRNTLLAFRYVDGETPVPILVAKSNSTSGTAKIKQILPRGATRIRDPLAVELFHTQLGGSVSTREIHALAQLMSSHNLY